MSNPYTSETIEALAAYFAANGDYTTEQRPDGRTVHIFRPKQPLVAPESLGIVERFNMHKEDITITAPGLYNGQPTIRGTGLTVTDLLGYLADGITTAELVERYPGLTRDDIRACQAWQQEQSE